MKVFIVFCGLLIINLSFLSFQGDMARYVRSQDCIKAAAEECAAGAALYYDETFYSEGKFRFHYEEGQKYIDYILKELKEESPLLKNCKISYEVKFQDDYLGYDDESPSLSNNALASEGDKNIPSVTVSISVVTEDLFRLPFLEVTKINRMAKYELPQ